MQLRDDRANALLESLSKDGASVIPGWIGRYLDFKAGDRTRRHRLATLPEWSEFLLQTPKFRPTSTQKHIGAHEQVDSLERQYGPVIGALYQTKAGRACLAQIATRGAKRMSAKHRLLLELD